MENKFTTIKERVLQLIEYKSISKESFFRSIGMTSANFRGKAKETPLNSNAIQNIISHYPEINLHWLITGNGSMIPKKEGEGFGSNNISNNDLEILNKEYYISGVEDVKQYLSYSEKYIKAKCSDYMIQLKEEIQLNNKLVVIANTLKITNDTYYNDHIKLLDEKKYLEGIIADLEFDSYNFDSSKIKWILKFLSIRNAIEHILYCKNEKIRYLERGVKMYADLKFISFNDELIKLGKK